MRSIALSSWLSMAIVAIPGTGCSSSARSRPYKADSISGRVVDAATRAPIPDVIVVAEWQLVAGIMDPVPIGDLELRETTTDPDGSYHIEGFGPVETDGRFNGDDPRLLFFKKGYALKMLSNWIAAPGSPPPDPQGFGRSVWDGKTIELTRGGSENELDNNMDEAVDTALKSKNCAWKNMPRLLRAFVTSGEDTRGAQGRSQMLRLLNSRNKEPRCGTVEAVIEERK
jgi:hypothetical protein